MSYELNNPNYLYCCTVHLVDSIIITLASLHEKQRTQIQDMLPQQYYKEKVILYIYLLTAIGLSPGGSTHLHTNNTYNNTTNNTYNNTVHIFNT